MSAASKVVAQTHTQTDRHTHRRDENIASTAYAEDKDPAALSDRYSAQSSYEEQ